MSSGSVSTQDEREVYDPSKKRKPLHQTVMYIESSSDEKEDANSACDNVSMDDVSEDEDYAPSEQSEQSEQSSEDDEILASRKERLKRDARKNAQSRLRRKPRDSFIVYTDEEESELEDGSELEDDDSDYDDQTELVNAEDVRDILLNALKKKMGRATTSSNIEESLTQEEETYFKGLDAGEKERLKSLYTSVMSMNNNNVPVKFQILNANIDNYLKNIALQKYESLMQMEDPSHGEYHKLNNWVTTLCRIPFGKYVDMPVSNTSQTQEIRNFLIGTKQTLQQEVYGHDEAKEQILRIVAQWVSNPRSKGNVIGIHGKPGVGKTTLIKNGVCKALNIPFAFIPLGGAQDSSYLEGHSYTYEGSANGKIVDVLVRAKVMNPVIYFDELDKVSGSKTGQDIINILIHLTDPSQNTCFQDKYFSNIDFDLSKSLIIFTYNDNDSIDPILKDRMITIHTKDYTTTDKIKIASGFLIPTMKQEFNISELDIGDDVVKYIIEKTASEAGVRNLKRSIEKIVSNINLDRLLNEETKDGSKIVVERSHVDKYLKESKDVINESVAHLYT